MEEINHLSNDRHLLLIFQMDDNVVHRRTKSSGKNQQENRSLTTKKRKQRNAFISWRVLSKSIIGLIILASSYLILTRFLFVEYTNVPINLPKLVNNSISERFWGTYR